MAKASIPNQIIELLQQINAGRITPAHIQALLEMPDEVLGILANSRGRGSKKTGEEYLLLTDGTRFLKVFPDGTTTTVVSGEVSGAPLDLVEQYDLGAGRIAYRVQRGATNYMVINGSLNGPYQNISDCAIFAGHIFYLACRQESPNVVRVYEDGEQIAVYKYGAQFSSKDGRFKIEVDPPSHRITVLETDKRLD